MSSPELQLKCANCGAAAFRMKLDRQSKGPVYTDADGNPARWQCGCGETKVVAGQIIQDLDPTTGMNGILDQWAREIRGVHKYYEVEMQAQAHRLGRRSRQASQEAWEWAEQGRRAQEHAQRLTGALRGTRNRLDKMHKPGCLRVGYDCPACEAIEDLDSY